MKKILTIIAILLITIIVIYFGKPYLNEWQVQSADKARKAAQSEYLANRQAELDALIEAYKADTYGGTTPQETWAMFIEALKAGDTDLAAMYFIPEKQEEEKAAWAIAKEKGFIPTFLSDFDTIIGSYYFDNDPDTFEYYTSDIDNGPGFIYTLIRNKQTNIWKISDL